MDVKTSVAATLVSPLEGVPSKFWPYTEILFPEVPAALPTSINTIYSNAAQVLVPILPDYARGL